jgi:hypothetical protein
MKLKFFDYDTSLRVRMAYDDVAATLETTHRGLSDHEKAGAKTRIVSALIDAAERGERDLVRLRSIGVRAIRSFNDSKCSALEG